MEATTLTKNNVQVIQQAISNFQQGNIPAIIDACTDDVQFFLYKVPNAPFTGAFYGIEGIQQFFATLGQLTNYTGFETRELIAQGDSVIALVHQTATVKNTGKSFDHELCMHFRVRDGKIAYYFGFIDSYDLYKASQE
jgi:ketosteroid isomerase-like protein